MNLDLILLTIPAEEISKLGYFWVNITAIQCLKCFADNEIKDYDIIKPKQTILKIVEKLISFTSGLQSKCAEYVFHSIHNLIKKSTEFINSSKILF